MRLNFGAHKWLWMDGYGRMTTGFARALLRAGHSIYPFELGSLDDKPGWFLQAQGLDFSKATLQFAPPNNFKHLPGRSVGMTMHESTQIPIDWANHVNQKSQVLIVPHPWLVDVFREGGVEVPIEVVLSGLDPDETPILGRNGNRPFTFGCLGDRGLRKGWDLVYMAFYAAFGPHNRDVRLIIKARPGSLKGMDYSYSRDDRLTVWREDVEKVADVFTQFDAFIFPSRCEGWGMPPREASACGVPTVVTRWSGLDDQTDEWAIPLEQHTLVESHMETCGGLWAEPNLDEIVEVMRWLYDHQDEAKTRALSGAQWLRDNRTYGQAANNLILTINKHLGGPIPEKMPVVHSNGHKKVPAL